MSDRYGYAQSNHFKVKDITKFKEALSIVSIEVDYYEESDTCVLSAEYGEYGGWVLSYILDDEIFDFDLISVVSEHMIDGQVCVLMECGAEQWRYLTGNAIAFDNTRESVSVSLNDIYAKAEECFGIKPTQARFAR